MVALPEASDLQRQSEAGGFRLASVAEVGGAVAAATSSAFGSGELDLEEARFVDFEWDDARHHAIFEPLESTHWALGVVVHEDDFVGAIRVTQRSNTLLAIVIAGAVLVLGAGLARNVTRPLQGLRRRAGKVQAGELHDWGPIKTRIQEIRVTVDAFDKMVAGLREQERRNADLREGLAQRVESRTAELRREIVEREHAEAEAEEASHAKSEFLANMSHEMRTPLNAILGLSELMNIEAFGSLGNDQYREYARDIHEAGDHLLGLITDILDLSVIEAGKLELDESEIDLGETVDAVLRMLGQFAAQREIDLVASVPSGLPPMWADERRMRQIIINLANNSVKFTPNGGRVEVAAGERADGAIEVRVSDTGVGMTGDQIETALSTFGQLTNPVTSRESGSGLGLPITKRLVEAHGGEMSIQSTPGEGTTIELVFPALRRIDPLASTA